MNSWFRSLVNERAINRNWQAILSDVGLLLHVPGVMALSSIPVAAAFGQFQGMAGFGITALLAVGSGQVLYRCLSVERDSDLVDAMTAVALAWALIGMFGALPFLWMAWSQDLVENDTLEAFRSVLNALFESFSGITSTGLTVARDPSNLPECLQWWRSFNEWVGGVGVVVVALTIAHPDESGGRLFFAEARTQRLGISFRATARHIWQIYLLLSMTCIVLFYVGGMPGWEALNHGLSCISTGGFTITPNSFAEYSGPIKWIACLMILLGAISFRDLYLIQRKRRLSAVRNSSQLRLLILWFGVGLLALWLILLTEYREVPFIDTLFQWVSAAGTCGFASMSLLDWNPAALLLLILAMTIGGAAGSTTGGLKLNRMLWLLKWFIRRFRMILSRKTIRPRYYYDGELVPKEKAETKINAAWTLLAIWLLLLCMGAALILWIEPNEVLGVNAFFEAASALGSVGLSVGISSPDSAAGTRIILILLMWMGRLEIIGVIVLLSLPIRNAYRHLEER